MLSAYADAAKSVGLDPYRMLRKASLPLEALTHPDYRIPVGRVQELIAASARAAGCEEFGLLVGRSAKLGMKGPLGLLMREQPTVKQAIDSLTRYLRYQNDNIEITTERVDGNLLFIPILLSPKSRADRHMVEMTVASYVQILRTFLGQDWRPRRVFFAHRPPKDLAPYRELLGNVEFGGRHSGFVLTSKDLAHPIPGADPQMAREIVRYIEQTSSPPSMSMGARVAELIDRLLPEGHCTLDHIARLLGVDRRTIHRRLAIENQSFSRLLDAARRRVVAEQLKNSREPLSVFTTQLGFSSLSTFSRWFRQAYGVPASEFRHLAQGC